jgi:hypothetical protein
MAIQHQKLPPLRSRHAMHVRIATQRLADPDLQAPWLTWHRVESLLQKQQRQKSLLDKLSMLERGDNPNIKQKQTSPSLMNTRSGSAASMADIAPLCVIDGPSTSATLWALAPQSTSSKSLLASPLLVYCRRPSPRLCAASTSATVHAFSCIHQ